MAEPNHRPRRARERITSPYATGEPLSRQELAELVNAWVYDNTTPHQVIELNANYIGQLERGTIRWPQDPLRRARFRAVLDVTTDTELGFRRPRRSRPTVADVDRQEFIRAALGVGAATVAGPSAFADLITPTQPTPVPSVVGWAEVAEVAEVRNAAQAFGGLQSLYGGEMVREAVIAQLRYCTELLNARADRLTATERAMLHSDRAPALAKLGRVQDTAAAVGVADEEFSHAQPDNDPLYVRYYDAAFHAGLTGRALRDVAVHGHFITEARPRLDTAITSYRDEYARARVMSQIELASLVMVTGDPGEAAMIGGQALDAAATIRSRRVADDMHALSRFGEPHKRLAEVAELTHRIGSTVVV